MTFSGYFFPSGSTKTSDYKITPNPHVAKNSLENPDFEGIYHFSVNSYHTSAEGKSIP